MSVTSNDVIFRSHCNLIWPSPHWTNQWPLKLFKWYQWTQKTSLEGLICTSGLDEVLWELLEDSKKLRDQWDHFVVQQCYLRVQCHKRALLCQLRAQWGHWVAWWGNSRASWDYKVNLSCKWSKSRSLLILLNSFGAQGDHLGVQ